MDCQQSSEHCFHTLDVRIMIFTSMYSSIAYAASITHDAFLWYSRAIVIDVENEGRHSIDHHRVAIIIPGSCWPHGNTIQQCWPGYVRLYCNSLTRFLIDQVSVAAHSKPTFITIPFTTHFDTIKGHATRLSECAVTFPAYILDTHIGPNAFENSLTWRPDSS